MNALSVLVLDDAPACCEDEHWEPIPAWPHEASTCGRIRSITRTDAEGRLRLGQMLPQHQDKRPGKGYVYATLRDGKRRRKVHVAVAVLEAHDKLKPGPDYDACHGDHVRTQNHLWNLGWDTHARNVAATVQRRLEQELKCNATRHGVTGGVFPPDSGTPRRRYGVTGTPAGNAAHGTGTSVPFLPFRLNFLSFNPVPRTVRTLLSRRSS